MPSTPSEVITHPFANTTSKLEILSADVNGIDVEEEARLYEAVRNALNDEPDAETSPKTSAGTRLKKSPKTPPSESIFSADIFLADNSGQRGNGGFARDVKITGWSTVGDGAGKKKGLGAYVVYECTISTKEGTTMHILKRYSAFEELYEALYRSLPKHLLHSLPALPPKAPLSRFRPAFLDSRRKLLEFWLSSVLLHPEVGGAGVVQTWVLK